MPILPYAELYRFCWGLMAIQGADYLWGVLAPYLRESLVGEGRTSLPYSQAFLDDEHWQLFYCGLVRCSRAGCVDNSVSAFQGLELQCGV